MAKTVTIGAVGAGVGVGIGCGITVRTATDVIVPTLFVAVIIYVVVDEGDTVWLPANATFPMSGLIVTELAPITFQLRVAELPVFIVDGVKSKTDIIGVVSWQLIPNVVPEIAISNTNSKANFFILVSRKIIKGLR